MSDIIVEQLAGLVGTSGEELVKQLQAAGIAVTSPSDKITNDQKLTLLNHLRQGQASTTNNAQPTLSLKGRADRKPAGGNTSSKKATVRVKRRPVRRAAETSPTASVPPAEELQANRSEELTKQLEAERKARTGVIPNAQAEEIPAETAPEPQNNVPEPETEVAQSAPEEQNINTTTSESTLDSKSDAPSDPVDNTPETKETVSAEPESPAEAPTSNAKAEEPQTSQPKSASDEIISTEPSAEKKSQSQATKPTKAKQTTSPEPAAPQTSTAAPEPQKPTEQTDKTVPLSTSFEAARRQRDSVAAAAKEEAASMLKRRPSRKVIKPTPAPAPAPASTEKTATPKPAASDAPKRPKRIKPAPGSTGNASSDADKRRNRRNKNKNKNRQRNDRSVRIERSTEHAFEKPTAPVIHEIEIPDSIVVSELARMLSVKSSELIKSLMKMGMMVTINQTIDQDTAILLTEELGHKASPMAAVDDESIIAEMMDTGDEFEAVSRPPVVTIMGHVDHGKTSLLDYIRSSRVASGEAGGITQHIGAYHVETDNGIVSFLDTPGHAAFTAMRARGAQATDIVVLVVAADDGVKPQTIEAIQHTRAAGVPLVVAINKMDKEEADPERVRNELSQHEVISEDWGGDDVFVNVSAKTGEGVDNLLDSLVLVSEILELKAPVDGPASGIVVEASIEKGRGAVATILVQKGTLKQGDMILCGTKYGRVRAMLNESGKQVKTATPSIPVSVLGLSGAPSAGDEMLAVANERKAREIADRRHDKEREARLSAQQAAKLEAIFNNMKHGEVSVVNILLKADVQGSVEALRESLTKLSTDEVKVNIVSSGVGGINESDATLAQASDAIIIGFNVRADATARRNISEAGLDLRYYSIIYQAIDDVRDAMSGLLSPELREEFSGLAEVKDVFRSSAFGAAAGCLVMDGTVKKGLPIRVLRDDVVVFEGELESLRRHKDDVEEVRTGTECGIAVKNYNDIQPGDQIECFKRTEVARTI